MRSAGEGTGKSQQRQAQRWQASLNATDRVFPDAQCIHELFELQAAATPHALALVHGSERVEYRELNQRANRLAHHLRGLGVRPDDRVAICVGRGIPMVVGLLAVLKAGGAYVPLDPTYPPERLAFMRKDSAPTVVLAEQRFAALFADAGVPVLDLGAAEPAWHGQAIENPARDAIGLGPTHLAYVVYTSGSTGLPKGVAVEHRGLCNLVTAQIRDFGVEPDSRVLQFASFSFDASVSEVMMALCRGAALHLPPADAVVAGETLIQALAGKGITHVTLPPAVLAALPGQARLDSVHTLIVAGDALPAAVAARWSTGRRLINAYGPSEITVCASMYQCQPGDTGPPPIGRPIANTRIYLLDPDGNPVPADTPGELYIGGVGVARGYLNRPELTAQRFLPDPFSSVPGARMYRSGDLGRMRADGVIEFLGRNDFQVKIRGFRIELGEIEARLAEFPGIRDVAVLASDDGHGEKRLVAYVVPGADLAAGALAGEMLRAHVAARLPDYMIPSAFVVLPALPLTPNGKLDRAALPAPDRARPALANAFEPARNAREQAVCTAFGAMLGLDGVGRDDNFFALGGNSLLAVRLLEALRVSRGQKDAIAATMIFRHPTPATLALAMDAPANAGIESARMARSHRGARRDKHDEPIAIIAMAGRFPGAADVEAFWDNLRAGRESITRFAADELDPYVSQADREDPLYVPARGVIDGVELFDAAFFGISPREAELMDPQHRVFLELCWECLERGGHRSEGFDGPIGVFAGMNNGTYLQRHVSAHPALAEKLGAFQVVVANEKDYIATRVSHKMNLTGPAISTHSACSTSLVAICQAVDSLRAGHCDMALAGAASITCPPRSGYRYQEGAMLSPDGHTRTFDRQAQGTVFSDGAAVVLLKRLSDARADGDPVIALVRGGAINNDGGQKASFTAPSSEGQAAVIAMAHDNAGVEARSIGYVEAHGTATPLGDPIEIEGLTRAFRRSTDDSGFCRIGSVKSNVGHLVAAAGAAGVIKAALSLRDGCIPATLHFDSANPTIDFAGSPFVVNDRLHDWPVGAVPRRAGVSSFGVGGTNAHLVLEEAPPVVPSDPADGAQVLVLSARTPAALANGMTRLATFLESSPEVNLADVAWTLAVGRKAFAHRACVVAADPAAAAVQLRSLEGLAAAARSRPTRGSDVVFLFPGQGALYPGMGREMYRCDPAFRAAFDQCATLLQDELGFDLRDRAFGDDPDALLPTAVMQPATFAIEYALAQAWLAQGLRPAAMVGHSIGEFVAATLAGVFSLADALRLVARRGRLMQAQPAGGMLSIRMPLPALLARLPATLSLAAENSPAACVVAGQADDIGAFQVQLEADGIACRPLRTSHAFHSAMMAPVMVPFRDEVAAVARGVPTIPIVSCVTGDWLDPADAMSPEYWSRHLREPVLFSQALGRLLDAPARAFLEVGPRATLTTLAKPRLGVANAHLSAIASLADSPDAEVAAFRAALGQLWCRGVDIDPAGSDRRSERRRLCLPTYPFEHQRYWLDAPPAVQPVASGASPVSSMAAVSLPVILAHPDASPSVPELSMPISLPAASADRRPRLVSELKDLFEDVAGFDLSDADENTHFIELGLDSLTLTQVATQLQKSFPVKVTFRQLMAEYASLSSLAGFIDAQLPADVVAPASAPAPSAVPHPAVAAPAMAIPAVPAGAAGNSLVHQVIQQQMQIMAQQLALLTGGTAGVALPAHGVVPDAIPLAAVSSAAREVAAAAVASAPATAAADDEANQAQARYDVKKAFGAIARIDTNKFELNAHQRQRLDAFMQRYIARTPTSKAQTQANRAHMADPRVVSGFRPLLKEIVYQIIIGRSKGSRLWDIDGNEYIDAINGFGMSLFGWQPEFILAAVREQLDLGYEIGPQHPLAGEVTKLICELTGHDRAALCNTGSEAVLGALRIARTVTGRSTVVVFNGSYHGINDEVIVRGTKKLKAVPGAPGILRNTAENVLVLDYGTSESLEIIRERAGELAAVLVEPVQSRRADFQPVEFLREVRKITEAAGCVLIFDEVITGFRSHPGGVQAMWGIQADLGTYGKVIGGGYPIGVIAGKRAFMDALDGGHWQFGDDSVPTVGVTYFAGTFVRHPLALAAAKAALEHFKAEGPALQERLSARTAAMANELNAFCTAVGAPIRVKQFASMWRTQFEEEHPLQDLLFAMMRSRGIHILDNFPCYFTTAHSEADIRAVTEAYKASVEELMESGFVPRRLATPLTVMDAEHPPVAGARLGREPDGRPAWFVPHPELPGKFVKVAR